jgi:hypothetical protein
MPYLALIFDTPLPAPALGLIQDAQPAVSMYRLRCEPMQLRAGSARVECGASESTRSRGLSGLLWIEARDLNDALRAARDCGLERHALLELHSLEAVSPLSAGPAAPPLKPRTERP